MSHRKNKKATMDEQGEDQSIAEGIIWRLTAYQLTKLKVGEDRARKPNQTPQDFYDALKSMDETGSIIKRLDVNVLNSISRQDMGQFLNFYAVACITGIARKLNTVNSLTKFEMIAFQNPDETGDSPAMAVYPQLASVLTPIESEYPYFCNLFLGIFQSQLEITLGKKRLLPVKTVDRILQADIRSSDFTDSDKLALEHRIDMAKGFLTPRKLLAQTHTAMIKYFEHEIKQGHRILIKTLADLNVSHVFLWLLYMDLIDEIVDGLLIGRPVFRQIVVEGRRDYVSIDE